METIDHEYYVSLEVSKLLKEAGFDWDVNSYYNHILYIPDEWVWEVQTRKPTGDLEGCPRPTLDVAQRWLREVKGLLLGMKVHDNSVHYAWEYTISSIDYLNLDGRDLSLIHWLCDNHEETENIIHHGKKFIPYEEVLEAGIKKALEIILEKGE